MPALFKFNGSNFNLFWQTPDNTLYFSPVLEAVFFCKWLLDECCVSFSRRGKNT
jgi:hypothetical protein